MIDEACEHLVEAVQIQADDDAGADHNRGRLPGLMPVREVDLRQLAAHLAGEVADAGEESLLALYRLAAGLALGLPGQRSGDAPPAGRLGLTTTSCHGS